MPKNGTSDATFKGRVALWLAANSLAAKPREAAFARGLDEPASLQIGSSIGRRFAIPFQKQAVERKHVTIAYSYDARRGPYSVRRPLFVAPAGSPITPAQARRIDEEYHMRWLERFLEASFPTYRFRAVFEGDSARADVAIRANGNQDITHQERDGNWVIQLSTDVVLIHELGHYLGLSHHYDEDPQTRRPLNARQGLRMPPGPRQERTFDGSLGAWCNACLAALDIPSAQWDTVAWFAQSEVFGEHYERP